MSSAKTSIRVAAVKLVPGMRCADATYIGQFIDPLKPHCQMLIWQHVDGRLLSTSTPVVTTLGVFEETAVQLRRNLQRALRDRSSFQARVEF